MKRIYLLFAALLLITSCLAQDDIGKTFPKTIKFEQGVVVGDTGDFVQSIVFDNGKVEMNIDGVVYQLQPVTLSLSIDSASVGLLSNDTIVLYFDGAVYGTPTPAMFDVYFGDLRIDSIESVTVSGSTIKLKIENEVLARQVLTVSYQRPATGGITDILGNQSISFYGISINNHIAEDYGDGLLARYSYEQNVEDLENDNDGTVSDAFSYVADNNPVLGIYMGNFSGSLKYIDLPLITDINPTWSFSGGVKVWNNTQTKGTIFSNGNIGLYLNMTTGQLSVENEDKPSSGDDTDDFESYSAATLAGQGDWKQIEGTMEVTTLYGDNRVNPNTVSTRVAVYYDNVVADDQYSQITIDSALATGGIGVAVRASNSAATYYGWYGSTSSSNLRRINAGSQTTLATGDGFSDDDVIKLEIEGYELKCYKNGTLDTSIDSDGLYDDSGAGGRIASGYLGIVGYGNNDYLSGDDWLGGPFTASGDTIATSQSGVITYGENNHIVVTIDSTTHEAHFWVDNVDQDQDTLLPYGFDFSDSIRLGADKNEENQLFGYQDLTDIYDGLLSTQDISDIYNAYYYGPPNPDYDAPVCDTAYVGRISSTVVELVFDETLYGYNIDTSAFVLTEGGSQVALTSSSRVSGGMVLLYCSGISAGSSISVTYTPTGSYDIQDESRNITAGFTQAVGNKLAAASVTAIAHYKFENNTTDAVGNYPAYPYGGFNYSSYSIAGNYSGGFDGSSNYVETSSINLSDAYSISLWFLAWLANENMILVGGDNWSFGLDNTNGHLIFRQTGQSDIVSASGLSTAGSWAQMGFVVDTVADQVTFLFDGDSISTHSTASGLDVEGSLRFGEEKSGSSHAWCYIDDIQVYDGELSDANAASIKASPGTLVTGDAPEQVCSCGGTWPNCDQCPAWDGIDTIYFYENYDDWKLGDWEDKDVQNTANDGDKIEEEFYLVSPGYQPFGGYGDGGTDIVEDPASTDTCVQVTITAGSHNADDGELFYSYFIKEEADRANAPQDLYYSLDVKTQPTFPFGNAGKIASFDCRAPCLDVNAEDTGIPNWKCKYMSTGPNAYNGFSCITVWKGGVVAPYLYHQDTPKLYDSDGYPVYYAETKKTDYSVPKGVWFNVTMRIRVNTFTSTGENYDGFIEYFINGELVYTWRGIRLLSKELEGMGLDCIEFTHFYGGDYRDALPYDYWFEFDNHVVFTLDPDAGYPELGELTDKGLGSYDTSVKHSNDVDEGQYEELWDAATGTYTIPIPWSRVSDDYWR